MRVNAIGKTTTALPAGRYTVHTTVVTYNVVVLRMVSQKLGGSRTTLIYRLSLTSFRDK